MVEAEQLWQEVIDRGEPERRASAHQNRACYREECGDGADALDDFEAAVAY